MVQQGNIQRLRHRIQLEPVQSRQKHPGKTYCIHIGKFLFDAKPLAVFDDKTHIKSGIVCHHDRTFGKFQEFRQHIFDRLRVHHHAVIDAGQLLDLKWNRHLRIDKDGKTIHDRTLFHTHRTDLDDPVCHRTETGCLDIKYDIWIIQTLPLASGDHAFHIIYQICLHAVNDFKRRIDLFHLILRRLRMIFLVLFAVIADDIVIRMVCLREGLYHPVICDCDGWMSPFVGAFYQHTRIGNAIHITHLCMAVQFHTFFRAVVHPAGGKITDFLDARQGTDRDFMVELVDRGHTFQLQKSTFFDRTADLRHLLVVQEHLYRDRVGKVCDIEHVDGLLVSDLSGFHGGYLSTDRDLTHLSGDGINRDRIIVKISSVDHIRVVRTFQRARAITVTAFLEIAATAVSSTVPIPEAAFVRIFPFSCRSCRLFSTVRTGFLWCVPLWFLFFSIGSDHPVFGKRGFHTLPGQIFLCIPVTVFVTDFGM